MQKLCDYIYAVGRQIIGLHLGTEFIYAQHRFICKIEDNAKVKNDNINSIYPTNPCQMVWSEK